MTTPSKPRFATAWLGGCSGCHMSLLDLDERLIELTERVEVVYTPFIDIKAFPARVDVTLVEGAVTNEANAELARRIRRSSHFVASFGDCATAGNVTAMRNGVPPEALLHRAYVELADGEPTLPCAVPPLAQLLPKAHPLHEIIPVDTFLHGCPPSADEIWLAVTALIQGCIPVLPLQFQRYG